MTGVESDQGIAAERGCRNAGHRPYDVVDMMLTRIAATAVGLLAAGAVLAGPAAAEPAPAVPGASDVTDFLNVLDGIGIGDLDPGQAVALGQSLCPLLAQRGQNTADIAAKVSEGIGRPLGPATMFTGAAISFLCPKAVDNVAGSLTDGRSLLPLFG